jgi:hypothetical protein
MGHANQRIILLINPNSSFPANFHSLQFAHASSNPNHLFHGRLEILFEHRRIGK